MKFLKEGQITSLGIVLCGVAGVSLILGTILYASSIFVAVIGLGLGGVFMGLGAFAAKARVLGLRSFTNDPLGWRKAKESYKKNDIKK